MTQALELGVNIDHVATLRQARGTVYPNLLDAVDLVEAAGAQAITIHLREDRRHIQDADVYAIAKHTKLRLNFEMAATEEMTAIALEVQPSDVCIVPEKREELTTEGGLDVIGQFERIKKVSDALGAAGIRVSLFIEPDVEHIKKVLEIGSPVIELHTGSYANAQGEAKQQELARIQAAASFAHKNGIHVNGGHGLDYQNTTAIAQIPEMRELNIGHSMIARSVFVGLQAATEEMLSLMQQARA